MTQEASMGERRSQSSGVEFVLEGLGRVHRPASVVGRVVLGAGLTLD